MKRLAFVLVGLLVALMLVAPGLASTPVPYLVTLPDGRSFTGVSVSTTPFTAAAGQLVKVNTASLSITVRLPSSPLSGAVVAVADDHANASVHPITVSGNGSTIDGLSTYVIDVSSDVEAFGYFGGAANEWKRIALPTLMFDAVNAVNVQVYRASDLGNVVGGTLPAFPLSASNGGTGLTSPGALGNVLTSNGAGAWQSLAPSGGLTSTSLFFDSVVAANAFASNTNLAGFTLGYKLYAQGSHHTLKGIRVWFKNGLSSTQSIKIKLCDSTPSVVASATNGAVNPATDTEIDFTTPQVLTPGTLYSVSAYETTGSAAGFGVTSLTPGAGGNWPTTETPWDADNLLYMGPFDSAGDTCPTSGDSQGVAVSPVMQ